MKNNKVAVVGAGITGLSFAYRLKTMGITADVFEAGNEAGGAIKTVRKDNWQIEYGPNTLLIKDKIVDDFIDELGLKSVRVVANKQADKRFIVKNGNLEPLPNSVMKAIKTPLFSAGGKARVLAEPFITASKDRDQTIADFVRRRLGNEILEYAINPFVAGIFANNPENLSLRHAFPAMDEMEQEFGSLIWASVVGSNNRKNKGRIPRELISFERGAQQMPGKIASELDSVFYRHRVMRVEKKSDGWYLEFQEKQRGPYEKVIVNVPLHKWDVHFLPLKVKELLKIKEVSYPPMSVLHLGYKKSDVSHPLDGFGFLVPKKENRKILGALFPSTLFEKRAPEDCHLLTVFIGGGRQPKFADLKSAELLKLVESELKDLIGLRGKAQLKEHIYWPHSIPAYHVGYDEILDTFDEIESRNKGLYLAGNFRKGISVPDCIKNGLKLADKISLETS